MKTSEEDQLRSVQLRAPSDALDDRIHQLLAATHPVQREPRKIGLWQAAVACAACAVVAFVFALYANSLRTAPQSLEVRHVVEVREMPFEMFDWTRYPNEAAAASVLRTRRQPSQPALNEI